MILNLSSSFSDIKSTVKHFNLQLENEFIIDCSTLIKLQQANFFSICEIENFEEINERSVRDYIQEIGKLSATRNRNNKSIRDIKIGEHNLFWTTVLAVKHPSKSLGKIVFLLDRILPKLRDKIANNNIYVSIPQGSGHYKNIITRILNKHGIKNFTLRNNNDLSLMSFFKPAVKLSLFYFKCLSIFFLKSKADENLEVKNYFITHTNKIVDENYSDFFLEDLRLFSTSITSSTYWPIFLSFKPLKGSANQLTREYKNALPSFIQVYKLLLNGCRVMMTFKWKTSENQTAFFDDETLINYEIKNAVINNIHHLFYGIWLKNYFLQKASAINVIYQDEFYETGRIISKVLESNNYVNTIGLQHGLFDLHHTVYGISNIEFEGNSESIPAPDIFVVWGNYFKNYFLCNNKFDNNRLEVLGNPRYFNFKSSLLLNAKLVKKILWCTDTPELTMNDILFLENTLLQDDNLEITIRMHPLYNFLAAYKKESKLFKHFNKAKISTNNSIMKDIQIHDLIIVNCFTTAFLDAYLNGKYCFRLYPYKSSPAYLKHFSSKVIANVYSESDILLALKQIQKFEQPILIEEDFTDIMNINIRRWEELLNKATLN